MVEGGGVMAMLKLGLPCRVAIGVASAEGDHRRAAHGISSFHVRGWHHHVQALPLGGNALRGLPACGLLVDEALTACSWSATFASHIQVFHYI